MAIVFLVLAVATLVGGAGGAVLMQTGSMPDAIAAHWPLIQNAGGFVTSGLALLGVALLMKKAKKLDRLVGGNTTSSRLRRTRAMNRSKLDVKDASPDVGGDDEDEGDPTPRPSTRATPRPSAKAATEPGTRQMRRPTGRVSNRRKP